MFLFCRAGVGQGRGTGKEFPRFKKGVFAGFKLSAAVFCFFFLKDKVVFFFFLLKTPEHV